MKPGGATLRNVKQKVGQINLDHQLIYRGPLFGGP